MLFSTWSDCGIITRKRRDSAHISTRLSYNLKPFAWNQLHLLCPEDILLADAIETTNSQAGITLQDKEHFGFITPWKNIKPRDKSTKVTNRAHLVMSKHCRVFFHIPQLYFADWFFTTGLSATAINQVLPIAALIQLPQALILIQHASHTHKLFIFFY